MLVRRTRDNWLLPLAACLILAASGGAACAVVDDRYVVARDGPGSFALAAGGEAAPLVVNAQDWPGVLRVARLFQADIARVTGVEPQLAQGNAPPSKPCVIIGTLGRGGLVDRLVQEKKLDVSDVAGKWDTFVLAVVDEPLPGVPQALVIAGSNKRGTIYGMFDLSAQIGVSPWYWWADVPVVKQANLYVLPGQHTPGEPAVKYRGIFINDEAPCLSGWMNEKFGGHNSKFYDHVFQLILRLKGNYLWPAMWGRSIYEDDPESPRLADEYGVVLATSHHEPMMRAHVDWQRNGTGPWNYERNEAVLREFWAEGIRRTKDYECVVTVGMRGDGDEPMTEEANIALLERIIADQRQVLAAMTGKPPEEIPQVWALYKEVQEYYDKGMRVPDDVTLLLCDDNWGNIRKLPRPDDPPRAGGYGIYYHFDYVGGPRNYKWLNTNPLPRVWEQMHLAYEHGVRRIWIVNVGDIKPMELPIEFFLDYAWNPDQWPYERLGEYTRLWAAQQFGDQYAAEIADILAKYLKFNSRRKPELLAPNTYSLVNYREAERIVDEYNGLLAEAQRINDALPPEYRDAYYQLVLHPVAACANLNELYVTAARNRLYADQGRAATNALAERVRELFARDAELSRYYNEELADGKWSHMMDQTHIGYTYWQEPPQNNMPEVDELSLPDRAEMGVAIEGSEDWWPLEKSEAVLPEIHAHVPTPRYIEVFNRGRQPFDCTIAADASWLRVGESPPENASTEDTSQALIEQESRFWIDVDWGQVPVGTHRVPITVTGPNDVRITVWAVVNKPAEPADGDGPFIETNGYVSIDADKYHEAVDAPPIHWKRLDDLGRTGSAMTTFPVTAASQTPGDASPRLAYRVRLNSVGKVKVRVGVAPTLNYYNSPEGLRYAVSFDDQPPQIVNICQGYSEPLWERWVARNLNETITEHRIDKPGEHILSLWHVDPGIVLQRLVIETKGVAPSYLGPPETRN